MPSARFIQIDDAAREQLSSVTEVKSNVAQMDSFTQQNAAMVEESTAAARNLVSLATELARQVGQFRLSQDARTGSLARAA